MSHGATPPPTRTCERACLEWLARHLEPALVLSPDGVVLGANPGAAALVGEPAHRLAGRALAELVAAEERAAVAARWSAVAAAGGGRIELTITGGDAPRPLRLALARLDGDDGSVYLADVRAGPGPCWDDVLAHAQAEQAAFHSLARHHPDSVIRYDRGGRITFVSDKLLDYFGLDLARVVGKPPSEVWPDGRYDRIAAAVRQAVDHGADTVIEMVEPIGNELIHHNITVVAERGPDGATTGAWAFGGKVTALRQAQAQAAAHAAMFRKLAESSPDLIIRFDAGGRVIYANPTVERTVAPAFLAGVPADGLAAPAGRGLEAALAGIIADGVTRTIEVELPTRGDGLASHELILVAERGPEGAVTGAMCLGRDITGRKRLERELRAVLTCAHAIVARAEVAAGDGWSPATAEQTADHLRFLYTFDDDEAAHAVLPLRTPPGGGYGEAWPHAIVPEDRGPTSLALARALAAGATSCQLEFRALDRDGGLHWFDQIAFIEAHGPGRWRITAVATDITKSRALEERLRQTQKMEALGQLAGGIAHDFNNILGAMMMQAELLQLGAALPPDSASILDELRASAERAAKLVRHLLAFSRKQVLQVLVCDLNDLVARCSRMLRHFLREDIELELSLAAQPLLVKADASMIEQVLLNLAANARDAMPRGGRLRIQTSLLHLGAGAAEHQLPPGPYVALTVTDTGTGISDDVLPRIFDPFFTTKEPGTGTGLGLATVFGVVEQHHGSIAVRSQLMRGTTFEILLPTTDGGLTTATQAPQRALPRGTGRVLLVEDESAVRAATARLLARAGYQVLEAADGVSAQRVWDEQAEPFDVLITDLIMPGGVTGRELAGRLRARRPDLHVVLTSGYSEELAGHELWLRDGEVFIPKPFSAQELLAALQKKPK